MAESLRGSGKVTEHQRKEVVLAESPKAAASEEILELHSSVGER